jgi:hypothetical protein
MTTLDERGAARGLPVRVLSDAHLRDAAPHADDPALVGLLQGLGAREPGRLVLNGDFFDFVKVTALPADPAELRDAAPTAAERRWGLGTGEARSAWKARRILDMNPGVAAALAALVARGHALVFLPGNHDAELKYPAVREAIVRRVDPRGTGRVVFPAWFWFEPGRLYVEHGSQYDRENALPDLAAPADAGGVPMPFGIVSSRYFTNIVERRCGLPPSDMGPGGYFLWVFRSHGLRAFAAIARYFVFAAICLLASGRAWRRVADRRGEHLAALKADALLCGMDLAAAVRIDALTADPIMASYKNTLLRLYLPQVTATVALWTAAVAIVLVAPGHWWLAPLPILASIAVLAASGRLYRGRIRERLEEAAASIAGILDVPCVVFGHDHNGVLSGAAPGNFVSSVWRFGAGPARLVEIPADLPVPRIVSVSNPPPEERP